MKILKKVSLLLVAILCMLSMVACTETPQYKAPVKTTSVNIKLFTETSSANLLATIGRPITLSVGQYDVNKGDVSVKVGYRYVLAQQDTYEVKQKAIENKIKEINLKGTNSGDYLSQVNYDKGYRFIYVSNSKPGTGLSNERYLDTELTILSLKKVSCELNIVEVKSFSASQVIKNTFKDKNYKVESDSVTLFNVQDADKFVLTITSGGSDKLEMDFVGEVLAYNSSDKDTRTEVFTKNTIKLTNQADTCYIYFANGYSGFNWLIFSVVTASVLVVALGVVLVLKKTYKKKA